MQDPKSLLDHFAPKNLNGLDRLQRVTIGGVFMSLVFVGPQTLLALIALYPIITGLLGRCIVCKWLEVDTLEDDDVVTAPVATLSRAPAEVAMPTRAAA